MSKISNVLTMLEYLSSGRKYSIEELAEKLEVSPRMIRVYKDEIEKAGIYIETIKGRYGGYVLKQNVNVPKRFIDTKAININDKDVFINKALKNKRKCYIEYYSKNRKSVSKRNIHPYDLILFGNEWGVAAYCEVKKEVRHFYLNRIRKVIILESFYN